MKIEKVTLRNFRRLENVEIDFEPGETVFVGPNNSGKTSATTAFKLFLKSHEFKIHDFSVSRIAEIDKFGAAIDVDESEGLPSIEMDLWLSIDPDMEFGSVFSLIPNVSAVIDRVGVRIKFCVKDPRKLRSEYHAAFPARENDTRAKTLAHFLSLPNNLSRHFALEYLTLEETADCVVAHHMDADEARKSLKSLVRVDFVDAQRNIDDHEAARSTRLSGAFATFYKKNLQQAEIHEEANRVIDENNENLNAHYAEHFESLMGVIHRLGVPSVNDRQLKLVSSLSPEIALQGNTSLLYVDPDLNHELPEAYNGLGFKNLVYMAIQVSHFHLQWINTEEKRPHCQIIFIEEPEAHLHSQVQQTFISNIWEIVRSAAEEVGEADKIPQLGISTHSSHILDECEFSKVRYFKRCSLDDENPDEVTTLNATKVLSLRSFRPNKESSEGVIEDEEETLNFLRKYMKLTHCDLFFSDAIILIEGTVEKLLLPEMIRRAARELNQVYLTTLEVGGAYASRFASLLEFIGLPYLVITDLDSVDPENGRTVCRADTAGSLSSNSSLKFFLGDPDVSRLTMLSQEEKVVSEGIGYIAYQQSTPVASYGVDAGVVGRTLEETFIYQNIEIFSQGRIASDITFSGVLDDDYEAVYQAIRRSSFKKTEFALDVMSTAEDWEVPDYITEGLQWLKGKVCRTEVAGE